MQLVAAAVLAGFVILAGAIAVAGRYEISATANQGGSGVYVLDRWSATVLICVPFKECDKAYPQPLASPISN